MGLHTDIATEEQLRAWAKGLYANEAAVELLLRAHRGRFARQGNPWVRAEDDGRVWLDAELIPEVLDGLSGGERRLMLFVASLLDPAIEVSVNEVISGMDRDVVDLVLAALAHAAGSHEHSDIVEHGDGTATLVRLGSLHAWPAQDDAPGSTR